VIKPTEREAARENIAENRKAMHDYHLLEDFEAGIALQGTEVKAIREGRVHLRDSYARVEGGEVVLYNVAYSGTLWSLSPVENHFGEGRPDPLRHRTARLIPAHIFEKELTAEIRPFLVPLVWMRISAGTLGRWAARLIARAEKK
jgi:hypothetical protein